MVRTVSTCSSLKIVKRISNHRQLKEGRLFLLKKTFDRCTDYPVCSLCRSLFPDSPSRRCIVLLERI